MVKYIIKRIITVILIFFGLTLVIYLLLSCVPGGNAAEREIQTLISGGTMPSDEQIQAIYAKYGLDKNVFMQYIAWLGNVFTGTWGNTYSNLSVTVIEAIGNKIGPTLILMGSGLLIAIVFGVLLGTLSALKPNGIADTSCTVLTFLGSSIPGFLISVVCVYVFSVQLGWLPSGYSPAKPYFACLLMPMLIVAFTHIGGFIKQTRGSVMDVMNEEYVKTAKAKGLSYPVVVGKHMLRNAALPICANIALSVPTLVGGSIVIERIFSWPGLGNYLVTCLLNKDIPVVMGIVSLIIIVVLVANLVLDLVYAALDPAIRARR